MVSTAARGMLYVHVNLLCLAAEQAFVCRTCVSMAAQILMVLTTDLLCLIAAHGETFTIMQVCIPLDHGGRSLPATLTVQAEALVLVGDPQQLPPTVKSEAAQRLGLGTSLYVRLQAMGLKPLLLDTQ